MFSADPHTLALVLLGGLFAGFTTGFAGFGTALVAAGFWYHVLPAALVPPVTALASVLGQLVGLLSVRRKFDWPRVTPFLAGGVIGVPFGVWLLALASPDFLRLAVGIFLMAYAVFALSGAAKKSISVPDDRRADTGIGVIGGVLGGFAGLSGVLPLIWLQLRGGPVESQRAIYQPFNMVVLALSALAMGLGGQFPPGTFSVLALALPGTIIGAWAGARASRLVSEKAFKLAVLALLLTSGGMLVGRAILAG